MSGERGLRAAKSRGIVTINLRNLRDVAKCRAENVTWGVDVDVESGGASVPLVWHIGEVHDDARLRAAVVVLEPRFRAGRARFFVELPQLEPRVSQFWPFLEQLPFRRKRSFERPATEYRITSSG